MKHLPLLVNRELFTEIAPAGMSCRHIEFDLSNSGLSYEAGDHLGVFPHNAPKHVQRIADRLNVDLDQYFVLEAKPGTNGMISSCVRPFY